MITTKKPAPTIEASGGSDAQSNTALSGSHYTAMKEQLAKLQQQVDDLELSNELSRSELNSAISALTQCHRDMPSAWSLFLVEKVYPSQMAENVRIRLRHGLSRNAGGFPRAGL